MTDHAEQELRLRLKGLRRDIAPTVELWPGIAARLHERREDARRSNHGRYRFWIPLATAASMLLVIGFAWKSGMQDRRPPEIQAEALAMAGQYQAALAEYAHLPLHSELQPALDVLDQSALRILAGIERYPDARFLLDQLRRTYDRRLELTQRAVITT